MAISQPVGRFNEEWDASQRGTSILSEPIQKSSSAILQECRPLSSRESTLAKASSNRGNTNKKPSSRRSSRAGSVRSLVHQLSYGIDEKDSIFFSPIPTNGNPTDLLAARFQAWRKVLKDIITYFREIQASYDLKAKSLQKVFNIFSNTAPCSVFLQSNGIYDATCALQKYYKASICEANKSKDIENEVIFTLVGLRSDLQQKIKEIRNLSGDFRNSLEREMESTRKAVNELQESLGLTDLDSLHVTGKRDPYLLKLATDHLVEKQIAEENYLHQAYLNLEASGRELEGIIVGEIQKSYNAFANILRREVEVANYTIEELHLGPIAMPKDHEWNNFIRETDNFVDPNAPMRYSQNIKYPGKNDELVQEIRAGLLERKSKYLKSYTAGWYVLTPTHLHEFKSIDKSQAPIMSLNLSEQKLKLFSKSQSASDKFVLVGRQTGVMHRGHSWVFRCESYESMMSWYETLKSLIDKSPEERNTRARKHVRTSSGASQTARSICSSDGGLEDEDEEPFSSEKSAIEAGSFNPDTLPMRPHAGGRFPSTDLLLNKPHQRDVSQQEANLLHSQSSESSSNGDTQNLSPKIHENFSGDFKSYPDKNFPDKQAETLNNSIKYQVSYNQTSIRQLELYDKKIQLSILEESPVPSKTTRTLSAEIDNIEVRDENLDDGILRNSDTFDYTSAKSDVSLEHVKNEAPQTSSAPRVESEVQSKPTVLSSMTGNIIRTESSPYVPGEWLNENYLKDKAIGVEED